MKRIIYILTVILLVWFISCKCNKTPVHKTMDKSTEKVLMNPHGITMNSGYVQYNRDDISWDTATYYVPANLDSLIFKIDTVFIHDTVYLKSKSKILDELMCDTCPKIEIPLINKH